MLPFYPPPCCRGGAPHRWEPIEPNGYDEGMRFRFTVRRLLLLMTLVACYLTVEWYWERWFAKPFREHYFPEKSAPTQGVLKPPA
jgi:hypothetical protein